MKKKKKQGSSKPFFLFTKPEYVGYRHHPAAGESEGPLGKTAPKGTDETLQIHHYSIFKNSYFCSTAEC